MTKYDLAAALTLAGLDHYEGALSASQQRTVFGAVLCGKKQIRIDADGQGTIAVRFSVWEGTHTSYVWERHSFEEFCRHHGA